ncbi:MAG: Stk1 family PASTA domain-containing Ser/Thr kinase [Heliobacteriaceae bacterium]|nr:Stk1 family PASTA domain-containing Ser/Thr kinase [Heliobacteriaceae bacterium]MDD4586986.1 Stk1 family PASTA domain-containing Ser/Thr kinase [Heliobacteriaceae bacterium]
MIGRLLGNRYQLTERLGGGGTAEVYKAWDKILQRAVTVKILRKSLTADAEFVRRFRREAQAIASLSHPNIVNVYDVGQEDETDYIVMEFIDGPTLKEVIRSRAPLSAEETVELAKQICDALEHAHQNGIIHRDIKPHNILLTRTGRVKVADFGIARSVTQSTMTLDRSIVGSVHYLSPEQARGVPVDEKSDIYALGVVMYELLSGQVPFQGDTPIAVALQQIQQEPPGFAGTGGRVPAALEEVVLRAMEKDPGRRYLNARALKEDLENVFSGRIVGRLPLTWDDSPTVRIEGELPLLENPGDRQGVGPFPADHPGAPGPGRRIKNKKVLWFAVFAGVALICLGLVYAWQSYMNVPEVLLPNVVGKHYIEATNILQRANVSFQVNTAYDPNVAKDIVIAQEPEGDRWIKQTREVILTVSLGPKLTRVPDVQRKPQRDAELILRDADFKPEIQMEPNDKVPAGTVISQNPQPNSEQAAGSTVYLQVSNGPNVKTIMPPLVGLKVQEGQAQLASLDVNVQLLAQEDAGHPAGTIISQDPAPKTPLEPGMQVKLVYSAGAVQPVPVMKTTVVSVPVSNDGKEHTVRIVLQDSRGKQEVYSGKHRGGDTVTREVSYTGKGSIKAYVDGAQVLDRELG